MIPSIEFMSYAHQCYFDKIIDEIKKQGIEVLLPDINESTLRFKEFNNKLLLPLTGITSFPIKTIINVI